MGKAVQWRGTDFCRAKDAEKIEAFAEKLSREEEVRDCQMIRIIMLIFPSLYKSTVQNEFGIRNIGLKKNKKQYLLSL